MALKLLFFLMVILGKIFFIWMYVYVSFLTATKNFIQWMHHNLCNHAKLASDGVSHMQGLAS
jgi:hypothetical protein